VADTARTTIAVRAAARTRLFSVAVLSGVTVTLAVPLPWRLAGLGFAALAVYTGLRLLADLIALRRAGGEPQGWVGLSAGLALAGFVLLLLAGQAALYPLVVEQERCTATALTHQDERTCRSQFEQRQAELLSRLRASSVPSLPSAPSVPNASGSIGR
jgi:hypothetical protein